MSELYRVHTNVYAKAIKVYGKSGGAATLILLFGTKYVVVSHFTSRGGQHANTVRSP